MWPQGFSWSSWVAQPCTLQCCKRAGVKVEAVLSRDHPPPLNQQELALVATDDVILIHRDREKGLSRLARLDLEFARAGLPKNGSKDVSVQDQVTGLGCDLSALPPFVEPAGPKLFNWIVAGLDVLLLGSATPKGFHAWLGLGQWFFPLQRSFFSILDASYAFVRKEPPDKIIDLPSASLTETICSILLAPLLSVSLDRPYLGELIATDAAPEFGFGVVAKKCTADLAARLGALSERRGDHIRLFSCEDAAPEVSRLGTPHRLHFDQKSFRTIISARAKFEAHSGVLELHGLLLAVKWLTRTAANHSKRVVILVDAKTVIGSATKGRSSARLLRAGRRSYAAHVLAAGPLPHLLYIPSESNPADAPSRGARRRAVIKYPATKINQNKLPLRTLRFARAVERLDKLGLL